MGSLKPVFGVLKTVVPILYCGGLLYYFLNTAGSIKDALAIGMGPALLGLTAIGLVFCLVLAIKLVLVFAALRTPGSGRRSVPPNDGAFDADAVVARYMARQSADDRPSPPTAPAAPSDGGSVRRSGFGRRIR